MPVPHKTQNCCKRMYNETFYMLRAKQGLSHLRKKEGKMAGLGQERALSRTLGPAAGPEKRLCLG